MQTDSELLRQYVRDGSEAAFTELVHRYGALVYSAALRSVGGPGPLAEEVTQDVFILLVRKAPMLIRHETLAGWLHTATRYISLRALDKLRKREIREQEAAAMQTLSTPEFRWENLRSLLDEAVGRLDDPDRNAVLLRYFQGWSHREVGAALGLSEDAARMRTERAVEKLRHALARGGVATSATLLAEVLATNSVHAAPMGLLGQVAATSFAQGRKLGLGQALLRALYMTTKIKIMLSAAMLAAAFATGWMSAERAETPALPPAKGAAASATAKKSPSSPANTLAQARAGFLQALHIPGQILRERALLDYVEKLDAATAKALLQEFAAMPPTADNQSALFHLSHRWAELQPEAALAWLLSLDDPKVRDACAPEIFEAYTVKDPVAALMAVANLPGSYNLIQLSVYVLSDFAQQDPLAALAALQALPNNKFDNATFVIFDRWAQTDPAAAAAAALKLLDSTDKQGMALHSIGSTWAEQDSAAALDWAGTLPEGFLKNDAMRGIMQTLATLDPAAAADYFFNRPSDGYSNLLVQQITRNWAQKDPTALLTSAADNLTGQAYNTAAVAALSRLGSTDPVTAATYLAQNPDPDVASQAVPALATNWATHDPAAALAWAQSLPADNAALRDAAIQGVFTGWTNTNPASAAAYLQQNLATDASFSALASHVASKWANYDPLASLKWAEGLPPAAQGSAAVAAMQQLVKVDPQSAEKAAQSALNSLANLTSAQQTALQKIANPATNP